MRRIHGRLPGARSLDAALLGAAALAGALLVLVLVAPVARLVAAGGAAGLRGLASDAELRGAIARTVLAATLAVALAVVGGTPLAYLLARRRFPGRALLAALVDVPLVLPHPVAGIALLLLLGRGTVAGDAALALGVRIVGTTAGIVAAMFFVAAPLYVSGAREAFAGVDRRYEAVARTLGDSPLGAVRRVALPLAARGLLASAVTMWTRAASDFGAVVILTYDPKVVSVLSYDRFTTYGLAEALPVAAALVLVSLVPLAVLRAVRRGSAVGR